MTPAAGFTHIRRPKRRRHALNSGAAGANAPQCSACSALHQVNELLEMEATRIAYALHDEAGQLLTAVHLKLAAAANEVPENCRTCFDEIRVLLDGIEMQLRRLSHELRPAALDDLGLGAALQYLVAGASQRTGVQIVLECSLDRQFNSTLETAVYRAVQEALTNIGRHSKATRASIVLDHRAGVLHCLIRDNGVGFDVEKHRTGLGLRSVRSRIESLGGCVSVRSRHGEGTVVAIAVPAAPAGVVAGN